MHSRVAKVLHRVGGRTLIGHALRAARALDATSTTVVVGHLAGQVTAALAGEPGLRVVVQREQLGTAHALLQTAPLFEGATGRLLLLSGDVPLLRPETLRRVLDAHAAGGASATVLTAMAVRPYGYGRVVRSGERIARIVEERDASPAERKIKEINAGLLRVRPRAALSGDPEDRREQRAGGVLPDGSGRGLPAPAARRRDGRPSGHHGNPWHQQSHRACGGSCAREARKERRADGERRDDRRSRDDLRRSGRGGRRGHGHPPRRPARGPHAHRRGLRNPRGRAHRGLHDRRPRGREQLLRHHRGDDRRRRACGPVRAPPARHRDRPRGAGGQLRRAEEDRARRGLEGQPPGLPGRRRHRRPT